VLIDGTNVETIAAAIAALVADAVAPRTSIVISTGIYHLMWDLSRNDIPPAKPR
jgi:hypothetical protein